ncbi:PaaI family thioesterase [Erythrobacter sp. NFXS35]|uniref:PaaI family thioesterase n=1 Tax=Erythrobacter sp. NFXS35 TaxID=2818436 RepID=UPI0032E01BDD
MSVAAFDHAPLAPEVAGGEDGWYSWNLTDPTRFNTAVLGEMRVRKEAHLCRLRMFPERRHTNLTNNIHGAVTLGLIDIALFAAMHINGSGEAGPSVTVELSTQFVGAGDPSRPLDAVSEIVRETGRMLFLRGFAVQPRDDGGEDIIASFSGIVRKMRSRG